MSVFHVVCFDLRDDELNANRVAELRDIALSTIPGLVELRLGKNDPKMYFGKAERGQGYTHALVSRHTTAKGLGVYMAHPDHIAMAKEIMKAQNRKPLALDFRDFRAKSKM